MGLVCTQKGSVVPRGDGVSAVLGRLAAPAQCCRRAASRHRSSHASQDGSLHPRKVISFSGERLTETECDTVCVL